MAKLNSAEIDKSDLQAYLKTESDFSFEMQVLNKLKSLSFSCSHGGTYNDPVTDKIREFDIRCEYQYDDFLLSLAVECKNIKSNFPLIASLTKRTEDEAKADMIKFVKTTDHSIVMLWPEKRNSNNEFYRRNDWVAKRIEQVGKKQTGEIFSGDSPLFEKITQAVNSSFDLIKCISTKKDRSFNALIIPVLVIPDNRLWGVSYNEDGSINSDVEQITSCSYYLNQEWLIQHPINRMVYRISHLEIVTFSEIKRKIDSFLETAKKRNYTKIA